MRVVPPSEAPVAVALDQKENAVLSVVEDVRTGVPGGERLADLADQFRLDVDLVGRAWGQKTVVDRKRFWEVFFSEFWV